MNRRMTLSLITMMFLFSIGVTGLATCYSPYVENHLLMTWHVEEITNFTMWYTGGGYCVALNASSMEFQITDVNDEVFGLLSIGNVSVPTNDTMVALDLTLGVWPAWLPGLFIEVGQDNIDDLIESAYAAAERVAGNWMNGTMVSRYENISVGKTIHECVSFDYQQDYPGTQLTRLAYSLSSGVLVEANTTVTFDSTYKLVISLSSIDNPTAVDMTVDPRILIVFTGIVGGVVLAVIVVSFIHLNRRKQVTGGHE